MGARKHWILSAYGILNIPVNKESIAKSADGQFGELHNIASCQKPLGRKVWCNTCNKEVPKEEVGKGFKQTKDILIPFTTEEINSLKSTDIPLVTLEVINTIEPLDFRWYKGGHYLITPKDANPTFAAPFYLLLTALKKTGKVALVRWFDSRTEYNGTLDADGLLSQIYFGDEVNEDVKNVVGSVKPELIGMITELIKRTAKPFNPKTDLVNRFKDEVAKLAMEKLEKGTFTAPTEKVAATKETAEQDMEALLKLALAQAETTTTTKEEIKATGTKGKKKK